MHLPEIWKHISRSWMPNWKSGTRTIVFNELWQSISACDNNAVITNGKRQHRAHSGVSQWVPECFADHILIGDAVVGQRLAPYRVEGVAQGLGSEFIRLNKKTKLGVNAWGKLKHLGKQRPNNQMVLFKVALYKDGGVRRWARGVITNVPHKYHAVPYIFMWSIFLCPLCVPCMSNNRAEDLWCAPAPLYHQQGTGSVCAPYFDQK